MRRPNIQEARIYHEVTLFLGECRNIDGAISDGPEWKINEESERENFYNCENRLIHDH